MRTVRFPRQVPVPRRLPRLSRRPRATRALGAAAALTLAATSLAACGSSGPGGGGDALQVWVYQDASTAVQAEAVERFNEQSDVDIQLTEVPGDSYSDRVRTAMGSDNAPDIFFNWGGGSISPYVEEDMLVDLTPIIEEEPELRDGFVPSILDAGAIDDRYYGIPMRGVQPAILYYNQTLFDEAGAEPPETLDDLFDLVDTFSAEGVTPAVLAGADPWTELMWLEYLVDREGGSEVFQRIQNGDMSAWGDPAMLAAAENAVELVDAGAFGDNFRSVSYTNDGASTVFAQGEAAMHLMGSWEYANQLANQPDFAENDLAYATFPVIEGGQGDPSAVVGNPTNYWSVNSNVEGERLDAAVEFLTMMASEEYAQALIDNGDVPATTSAADLLDSHPNPEFARWQYDMITNASSFQLSWDQALPARQSTPMIDAIEQLFGGQLSPREFVDEMQNL
jgi:xylobiose transport system substrate-binding protein